MPAPTDEEDSTPGRDALALCLIGGMPTKAEMQTMPDEWQADMARLINELKTRK